MMTLRRRLALTLPGVAAAVLMSVAFAAEEPPEAAAEKPSSSPVEARAEPPGKTEDADKGGDKKRGGDIFQPSEEISEDFAVSFPVDI